MELCASLWILLRLTLALGQVSTLAPPAATAAVGLPAMRATPVTPALLDLLADAQALRDKPEYIAPNIWVQPLLREAVDEAMQSSATFREQVRLVAAQRRAHVAITVDPDSSRHVTSRAHAELRTYSSGVLVVLITLPGVRDAQELVAHELEHVIERLAGVNLRREAARGTPGVSKMADGRLESQRALDAGLAVKTEVARARMLLTSR